MQKANLWDWVKALLSVVIVFFVSLKFYNSTFTMNFDFIALLSTVLALFSVGLSAVFYFKATETSNSFYDNTFKFTKDIAGLLIRIESGFGERLKSLDESYNSMRSMMSPGKNGDVTETKEKIELEETELNKVKAERSKLIEQLLEKANLEHEEKEKIQHTLNSKEEELQNLQFELARLNKRLLTAQLKDREQVTMAADMPGRNDAQDRVEMNMITRVIPDLMTAMGVPDGNYKINLRDVINFFNRKYWKDGRSPFSQDMVELGYCSPESGLNFSGARYMRNLIKSKI